MLELINFANYSTNLEMIDHSPAKLRELLCELGVDGIEALFCDPWDENAVPADVVYGVHLNFWPSWLSFWRNDKRALLRQFGDFTQVAACFGGLEPEQLLEAYRRDIRQAKAVNAKYVVFHVSHNEADEMYTWQFRADSLTVVEAACEVINSVAADIPPEMAVLLENLWWPGLTLLEPELVKRMLERIKHPRVGLMLDTGHLMNTNPELRNEQQGVEYILDILSRLGPLAKSIRGIHLHQSLSGEYIKQSRCQLAPPPDPVADMAHIMRIDQHRPFSDPAAKEILQVVQPEYLVHEFIISNRRELSEYTARQRLALGLA